MALAAAVVEQDAPLLCSCGTSQLVYGDHLSASPVLTWAGDSGGFSQPLPTASRSLLCPDLPAWEDEDCYSYRCQKKKKSYELVLKVFDLLKAFQYFLSGAGREKQKKNGFQLFFSFLVCEKFGIWFSFRKCKKGNITSVKMKYSNRFWSKQSAFKKNSNYNTIVLRNCCCLLEGVKYCLIVDQQIVWGMTPDNA